MQSLFSFMRLALYGATISVGLAGCSQPNNANDTTQKTDVTSETTTNKKVNKTVAITAIVEHPSLDAIRMGVIAELAEQGYKEGENLKVNFQSAQGNTATAGQISKQFVADNPDVIVAISTPSAQSMAASTHSIPIVYTAVSDPVSAKLIDSNNKAIQANITGLSSQLPLTPQLDFMQQIKPDMKAIGYVYSPGEANSVSLRNDLQVELAKRNIKLVDIPANRPTDIAMATRSLDGKADLIYTSMDNNVASAFEAMVGAAEAMKLPIIASDEFSVRRGATAGMGVNDFDFGRATGKMVVKILNGTPVTAVEPQVMNQLTTYISPKHANNQGVTLPESIVKNAINVDKEPVK